MDWQDVIDQIISQRSDIELVDRGPSGWACRPSSVFLAADDVPRVERLASASTVPTRPVRRSPRAERRAMVCASLPDGLDRAALTGPATGDPVPVQPNYVLMGQPFYMGGPGTEVVKARVEHKPRGEHGAGVTIAVLDTGLANHPWFHSIYDPAQDDVPDDDGDGVMDLQAGHGTFIAGIVHRYAPGATIVPIRALDSDGVTDEEQILSALAALEARGTHIDILNLSFGGYTENDTQPELLAEALEDLDSSTIVVAAAGNSASDRPFWPAAFPKVYGIGALEGEGGDPASFSNRGPWVKNWRPGVNLQSSFLRYDGPVRRIRGVDPDDFNWWASWSGTSFAAPHFAGDVAARMTSDDVDAPTAAQRLLEDSAE